MEMKMDENNPLRLCQSKLDSTELNRSGRPPNENIIRFGPQPKSFVSKIFEKIQENGDLSININVFNNTTGTECIAVENYYVPESNQQIALDPVVDTVKVKYTIAEGRKYACDFPNCNYACKLSSNLIKHKRTHTSEKPYLCHLCSFRSNFINSLKVHQRIHTAERPYACNHCVYRCNSSSNLKKHCKHRHSTVSVQKSKQIDNVDPNT